jgi:hypothetical protein
VIYFAGPASNLANRTFNLDLTRGLEKAGFAVFLPQRDGIDPGKPPYSEMTRQQRGTLVFEKSRDLILACDVFLFILDGRVPDESLSFHLGLAYAHRLSTGCDHLIIGFQTDGSLFLGAKLHPTLLMALDSIVAQREALIKALTDHKNGP